jgi:(p)ppGpp synthase/HD superfamily hydrolase
MKLTPLIQKAINMAAVLHYGQCRKGGTLPYITHPVSVAIILSNYTKDETVIAASLLHDVLEDVPNYRYTDLKRDFGERVANLVKEVTEDKDPNVKTNEKLTWQARKEKYIAHLKDASRGALLIAAADKIHNIRSHIEDHQKIGKAMWEKFNASPEKNIWFYSEVTKALKKRLKGGVVIELENAYQEAEEVLLGKKAKMNR